MTFEQIILWVFIVVNFVAIGINTLSIHKYHKLIQDHHLQQLRWHKEKTAWIANRKKRISAKYEIHEAKRYLAELNEMQDMLDSVSSKISSSTKSAENVG